MTDPQALSEEDILELLPWYATGKTSAEEAAAIERAVAASPALQAELALVQRERQVSVESAEAVGAPSPEFFDHALKQLDGARRMPPIARSGQNAPDTSFLGRLFGSFTTPALRIVALTACLVIVIEGTVIIHLSQSEGGASYQTASAPDVTAAGPHLVVQFQPNATMAAIGAALGEVDGGIVRGPMPDGSYIVALPAGADANAAIAALKKHGDLVAGVDPGS